MFFSHSSDRLSPTQFHQCFNTFKFPANGYPLLQKPPGLLMNSFGTKGFRMTHLTDRHLQLIGFNLMAKDGPLRN